MLAKLKLVKTPKGIDSVLMLSAMLILWIGNYSNLDLMIADSMFDGTRGQFAGGDSALAGSFQFGMILLGAAVIGLAIWDTLRPLAWLASRRSALRSWPCRPSWCRQASICSPPSAICPVLRICCAMVDWSRTRACWKRCQPAHLAWFACPRSRQTLPGGCWLCHCSGCLDGPALRFCSPASCCCAVWRQAGSNSCKVHNFSRTPCGLPGSLLS